jgi:hypothetical protein
MEASSQSEPATALPRTVHRPSHPGVFLTISHRTPSSPTAAASTHPHAQPCPANAPICLDKAGLKAPTKSAMSLARLPNVRQLRSWRRASTFSFTSHTPCA